ncbi:ArsA family ATPase [Nakamurella endophytica]|uniref:Anion transporter n=1 Tax=Nakamurella endophytica TaxID=1748367 RepID=A0A917T1B3_9ACTN|nr:ArsA-related P-loop ATPase [Nakamurella endophytica]GGM05478.1 anion transporter [Nakamurella endophytica]
MRQQLRLGALLTDPQTSVVVTCGSGGVGKTTTAAAMALFAADAGRRVAVLTIDPARRLAQSLGLDELDNEPRRVELDGPAAESGGELWAMMLDTRRTFDEMISAHSSPDRAAQIFANPFYRTISTSFSGTQEYMAMEKLSQLAGRREYDLIVVDTPPSRSALDFLDAPQRLGSFLDGRMIRLLSAPGRGVMKVVGAGFNVFARAVTSVIGGQMLADAGAFVQLFESMFGGFRERAQTTYDLLRSSGTAFVVVAIPEPEALREASYFADRLRADRMPLAGLVLNRTHPPLADLPLGTATSAAEELTREAPLAAGVLTVHADRLTVRAQELRMRSRLSRAHPDLDVVEVPALPFDAHDLPQLREIGEQLTAHG